MEDLFVSTNNKSQGFAELIEALKIIHKSTDKGVIKALEDAENGNSFDDEIINRWLDPQTNPEKGNDNYKVARCLVWYIAKHNLKIQSFIKKEFPYEYSPDTPKSSVTAE